MKRALTGIAGIAALVLWIGTGTHASGQYDLPSWTPVAGKPLKEPAQLRPGANGVVNVKLLSKPRLIDVAGAPLLARPFASNATGPTALNGPTIHVRPGGTIRVQFDNRLGDSTSTSPPTNIHYHGLHVSPLGKSDNIFRTFDNGKTYQSVVRIGADQAKGTYWYHVHFHGLSEGQVMGGLSGLLIVDGIEGLLPRAWRAVKQRQFALRDVQTKDGAIVQQGDIAIPQPSTRLVNALFQPTFAMAAGRYELWRLANIGADVFYQLKFQRRAGVPVDVPFTIVGEDGIPVWKVSKAKDNTLLMPPGKRYDVLVMAPRAGVYDLLSTKYAQRYVFAAATPAAPATLTPKPLPVVKENGVNTPVTQTLASATVAGSGRPVTPAGPLPMKLGPEDDLGAPGVRVNARHEFKFQYTPDGVDPFATMINDTIFNPYNLPMVAPLRDTVEEWTLVNQTTDDHPFHIHVNGFQVMSVNGKRYGARGHQDIVNIPAQTLVNGALVPGKVVIRQRFETFTGWFVFHCHILQHEDIGMMATIQVRRNKNTRIQQPPEYRGVDPGHGHGG